MMCTPQTLARSGMGKRGEQIIFDRRFKGIYVQGFTAEVEDIKPTSQGGGAGGRSRGRGGA